MCTVQSEEGLVKGGRAVGELSVRPHPLAPPNMITSGLKKTTKMAPVKMPNWRAPKRQLTEQWATSTVGCRSVRIVAGNCTYSKCAASTRTVSAFTC